MKSGHSLEPEPEHGPGTAKGGKLRAMLQAGLDEPGGGNTSFSEISDAFVSKSGSGLPARWVSPECGVIQQIAPDMKVEREIGRGGMGAVYLCYDPELKRMVAAKLLPPELARHPALAKRFELEGQMMAQLDHPNIVTVHRSLKGADGAHLLVMEYVEGTDLSKLLKKAKEDGKLVPLADALRIFVEVCAALQCAHDAGVIHRDVKPANILLDKKNSARVADFGLARPIDRSEASLTQEGMRFGTDAYMAPEHVADEPADHRMDIYALGVILYEIIAGEKPLGAWRPPCEKRKGSDRRLNGIVRKAMERNPADRWASAASLGAAVEKVRRTMLLPWWRRTARRAALPAAAAAFCASGVYFAWPEKTPRGAGSGSPELIEETPPSQLPEPPGTRLTVMGQKMVPFSQMRGLYGCMWETRVKDFAAFIKATGYSPCRTVKPERSEYDIDAPFLAWDRPVQPQTENDPVLCVSWDDADAFCQWLTEKERKEGKLQDGQVYRLPDDREWSAMAGMLPDKEPWLWERVGRPPFFSWGNRTEEKFSWENHRDGPPSGYPWALRDIWEGTAPVGSLRRTPAGFHDLGGNAREWILDTWGFGTREHAARSSGCKARGEAQFTLARRSDCRRFEGNQTLGFRILLDATQHTDLVKQCEKAVLGFHGGQLPPLGRRARMFVTAEGIRLDLTRCEAAAPLDAFKGIQITQLFLGPVLAEASLAPLGEAPLRHLIVQGAWPDLKSLAGSRLDYLALRGDPEKEAAGLDLSLSGISMEDLKGLHVEDHPDFTDLRPLAGCKKLETVILRNTRVKDLSALAEAPLKLLAPSRSPLLMSDLVTLPRAAKIVCGPDMIAPFWELIAQGTVEDAMKWYDDVSREAAGAPWLKSAEFGAELGDVKKLFASETMKQTVRWASGDRLSPPPSSLWSFGGSCYLFISTTAPQPRAEWFALLLRGHLAAITSPEEMDYLIPGINAAGMKEPSAHLGARYGKDHRWHWCNGEPWGFDPFAEPKETGGDTAALWGGFWHVTTSADRRNDSGILIEWSGPEITAAAKNAEAHFTRKWEGPGYPPVELLPDGRVKGRAFADSWWVIKNPDGTEAELYEGGGARCWTLTASPGGENPEWRRSPRTFLDRSLEQ